MARLADMIVCLRQPELFGGVGEWYQDFRQTSDAEVRSLLDAARAGLGTTTAVGSGGRS
jgi:putative phosphoribosyl transferase